MERVKEYASEYALLALEFLSQSEILFQIGLIGALFLPALILSRRLEPLIETRAQRLRETPGLLNFLVTAAHRLQWLFFVVLLAVAYSTTLALGWPENNYPLYSAMLLSGAWLLISVGAHLIRSPTIGRLFAVAAWLYVAATILGVAENFALLLDSAGFTVGEIRISVLGIVKAAVFLGVLLWVSVSLGNFFDRRIQRVDELTPSLRVLIGKILRISIIVVAVLVAMSGLGIDLTALTVLSGAVGVGIGFGLQKVVSNFISGIIILMDQSIKPGDTITLGETFGWIRELRARFVSVVTRDGREYLIPNEDFITREVINWSFSDRFVRLDVPFGVSYDSDPHEVTRLATEAAAAVDRVNSDTRRPVCWITEFGDSSLNFVLRFWIDDPQQGLTNIRGKVLMSLWDAFKENGVNIPYPHREVIMKTPVNVAPQTN